MKAAKFSVANMVQSVKSTLINIIRCTFSYTERINYIGCLAHEMHDNSRYVHVEECTLALEPVVIDYRINKKFIPTHHPVKVTIFPIYFYTLRNCYQSTSSGLVALGDTKLIAEEFAWGWGKTRTRKLWSRRKSRVCPIEDSSGVYVCSGQGYHGVVDDLAHLCYFYDRFRRSTVVVCETNRWLADLIATLLPSFKLKIAPKGAVVQSSRLLATSKSPLPEFINPSLLREVRKRAKIALKERLPYQKIYVSRAKSKKRLWKDEAAFEKKVGDFGFYIARLEDMSTSDQVVLFMGAKVVVGRHGAGLTNICFCQTKAQIIEIFEPEHFNACYSSMAGSLGHDYKSLQRITPDPDGAFLLNQLRNYLP